MRPASVPAFFLVSLLSAASSTTTSEAQAFCGFYVGGADEKLTNGATTVVLARTGTHTVLSMQNDYRGPAEDFAMVVPVPVVLQQEAVKTLPKGIFDRIDRLSAPRLVEYWQQDPCEFSRFDMEDMKEGSTGMRAKGEEGSMGAPPRDRYRVVVEAEFVVGEYDIVILGAEDSTGLDAWLRDHRYHLPEGAEPLLRPYVQAGSKFFVAKVDVKKVVLEGGRAVLSPLRFEYDEETFRLPVRLGLVNSAGKQDLVVHILAKDPFEAANYPNITIPTNIEVDDAARSRFPEVYAALFDRALEKHPGAVVTEYAWDAAGCDPCPDQPLSDNEKKLFGAAGDALVHTRLHARYDRESLGEDLVFRWAKPITGGRNEGGQGPTVASRSTFQGRYIIRHRWSGPLTCGDPDFDNWGGPPDDATQPVRPATDLGGAERGKVDLSLLIREPVPAIDLYVAHNVSAAPLGARRFFMGLSLGAGAGLFGVLGLVYAAARAGSRPKWRG